MIRLVWVGLICVAATHVSVPATLYSSLSDDKTTKHYTAVEYNVKVKESVMNMQDEHDLQSVTCKYDDTSVVMEFKTNSSTIPKRMSQGTILNGDLTWGCIYKGIPNVILARVVSVSDLLPLSNSQFGFTVTATVVSFMDCFDEAYVNVHAVAVPHNERTKHTLSFSEGADFQTLSMHLDQLEASARHIPRASQTTSAAPEKMSPLAVESAYVKATPELHGPVRSLLQSAGCDFPNSARVVPYSTKYECPGSGTFRIQYTTYSTNSDSFSTWMAQGSSCSTVMGTSTNPVSANPNFVRIAAGSCASGSANCTKTVTLTDSSNICLFVTCDNYYYNCQLTTSISFQPTQPCNSFQCASGACIPTNYRCDGGSDCTDASDEDARCVASMLLPTTSSSWVLGQSARVSWSTTYSADAKVRIELWNYNYLEDELLTTLATAAPNTGFFDFTFGYFPGFSARNDAYIFLTFTTGFGLSKTVQSPLFNLVNSQATISVTQPANNATVYKGTQTTIVWTSTILTANDMLEIRLKNYNSLWANYDYGIIAISSNAGFYVWNVPTTVGNGWTATNDFFIEIKSTSTGVIADSQLFTLQGSTQGDMLITSPNADSQFRPGDWINLAWNLNDVSSAQLVDIILWKDIALDFDQQLPIALSQFSTPSIKLSGVANSGSLSIYLNPAYVNGSIEGVYFEIDCSNVGGCSSVQSQRFMIVLDQSYNWNYNAVTEKAAGQIPMLELSCDTLGFSQSSQCDNVQEASTSFFAKMGCFLCAEGRDVSASVQCDDCFMKSTTAVSKFEWRKSANSPLDFLRIQAAGDLTLNMNFIANIRLQLKDVYKKEDLLPVSIPVLGAGIEFAVAGVSLKFGLLLNFDLLLAYDLDANGTLSTGGVLKLNFSGGVTKTSQGTSPVYDVDYKWVRTKPLTVQVATDLVVELGLVPKLSFSLGPAQDLLVFSAVAYLRFENAFQYPAFSALPYFNPPEGVSLLQFGACTTPHYIQYAVLAGVKDIKLVIGIDLSSSLGYQYSAELFRLLDLGPFPVLSGCLATETSVAILPLTLKFVLNPYSTYSQASQHAFSSLLAGDLANIFNVLPSRFYVNFATYAAGGVNETQIQVVVLPSSANEESSISLQGRLIASLGQSSSALAQGAVTKYLISTVAPTVMPTISHAGPTAPTSPTANSPTTTTVNAAELSLPHFAAIIILVVAHV